MKKVIDGKTYNTETAEKIVNWWNGLSNSDFRHCEETIYKTKKGAWFVMGNGGAMTRWSRSNGNTTCGGVGIIPLTEKEALDWCENHDVDTDTIETYFKTEEA